MVVVVVYPPTWPQLCPATSTVTVFGANPLAVTETGIGPAMLTISRYEQVEASAEEESVNSVPKGQPGHGGVAATSASHTGAPVTASSSVISTGSVEKLSVMLGGHP